jgi:hypothetical protein
MTRTVDDPYKSRVRDTLLRLLECLFLVWLVGGCLNGPVRYTALGSERFATVEFTRDADLSVVPLAVVCGVATDLAVTAGDTVAFIINTVIVGPVVYGGAVVRGETEPWTRWALPALIPVYMIFGGYGPAAYPKGQADALGLSEGPYGTTRKKECQVPAPQTQSGQDPK